MAAFVYRLRAVTSAATSKGCLVRGFFEVRIISTSLKPAS